MKILNLVQLIDRNPAPSPWEEGENIPWNEPEFSRRMLKEHLSQEHDAASRRFEIIDRQVEWIHQDLLAGSASQILDLGCGPGFYSERLAKLGHTCFGIDYSPASIEYATATAHDGQLSCQYTCGDIRYTVYPGKMDLVLLIYGEFNVFSKKDASLILAKAWKALKPGGWILLEPHTYQIVKWLGKRPASWYSSHGGLFHEGPHLVLHENFWDDETRTATIRYYVFEASGGQVVGHAQSLQAYHAKEYRSMLIQQGFERIRFLPGISPHDPHKGLVAIAAYKPS